MREGNGGTRKEIERSMNSSLDIFLDASKLSLQRSGTRRTVAVSRWSPWRRKFLFFESRLVYAVIIFHASH